MMEPEVPAASRSTNARRAAALATGLAAAALWFAVWEWGRRTTWPPAAALRDASWSYWFDGLSLAYGFVGAAVAGLARQWTGSILYGWIVHTVAIAWGVG